MENKAMYLSTYEERESGSTYEEAYDVHNLSKLNLCDGGEEALHLPLSPRGAVFPLRRSSSHAATNSLELNSSTDRAAC